MRSVHQVTETTRRSDKDVAALAKLLDVVSQRDTAVAADRAQHGTIAEATGLGEDLHGQLAGWANNDDERLGTNSVDARIVVGSFEVRTAALKLLCLAHQLADDGDKVGGRLSGAGLSNGYNVTASQCCGDGVGLNSSASVVATKLHVLEEGRMETGILKL